MRRLVVNADDFGFTSGVNRAVIEGHRRGIITSTTLMANMPGFDEAVRLARGNPSLGVGLHFNITQGRPVAPAAQVRSLTDGRGEFPGTSTAVAKRLVTGGLRRAEIVIELRAQIEKALNAGLRLSHVDSHKHTHALPQVFDAIIRTIPDYGIGAVRLQRERWRPGGMLTSPKVVKQGAVALALSQLCRADLVKMRRAGLRTTDAFFGITQTGFWTKQWLARLIENLPEGASELMCHPGYVNEEMRRAGTRLTASREQELRLLTDPEIVALVRNRGVKLVNYAEV
ncbi:MAG TPA: ChbG/HpnK family deacetylase [Blastocatellia bacterium]|nr:ChbG/HpnK family deacetylase [Blastocatellia bacterium]